MALVVVLFLRFQWILRTNQEMLTFINATVEKIFIHLKAFYNSLRIKLNKKF